MPNHWQGITSTTFIAHGSMTWRLCKWLRLFLHGYIYMFAHVLLCLRPGLLYSIKQCLRLTKNSLCWFGIPCSMLVFISLGTSLREVDGHSIMGDESQPAVQQSNMMLSRSAMLVLLCMARQVFWAVEQPSTSKLAKIRYFRMLLESKLVATHFIRLSDSQSLFIPMSLLCWLHCLHCRGTELDGHVPTHLPQTNDAVWILVLCSVHCWHDGQGHVIWLQGLPS